LPEGQWILVEAGEEGVSPSAGLGPPRGLEAKAFLLDHEARVRGETAGEPAFLGSEAASEALRR